MADNQQDAVDRKIDGLGKLTQWIKENPLAFLCSVLTFLLFLFIYLYVGAKNENISILRESLATEKNASGRVEAELRKQLPGAVKQEVYDQTKEMKQKVDTVTNGAQKFFDKVERIIK